MALIAVLHTRSFAAGERQEDMKLYCVIEVWKGGQHRLL
jgi:hypothetical protein